jgi:hypothetical protein
MGLLALGVAAYLGVKSARDDTPHREASGHPMSETIGELRSGALGTEAAVFGYLQTGDPRYQEQIAYHARAIEQAERDYAGAPVSDEEARLVATIGDLYREYRAAADDLMHKQDRQRELLREGEEDLQKSRTVIQEMKADVTHYKTADAAKLEELGKLLEGDEDEVDLEKSKNVLAGVQASVKQGETGDANKLEELARMEQGLDGVRTWSGAYLAHPRQDYGVRTNDSVKRLEGSLARYKELELTERERDNASELTNLLDEGLPAIEQAISLTDSIEEEILDLDGLQKDMGEVLDRLRSSARYRRAHDRAGVRDSGRGAYRVRRPWRDRYRGHGRRDTTVRTPAVRRSQKDTKGRLRQADLRRRQRRAWCAGRRLEQRSGGTQTGPGGARAPRWFARV